MFSAGGKPDSLPSPTCSFHPGPSVTDFYNVHPVPNCYIVSRGILGPRQDENMREMDLTTRKFQASSARPWLAFIPASSIEQSVKIRQSQHPGIRQPLKSMKTITEKFFNRNTLHLRAFPAFWEGGVSLAAT
jgi:hypothetical protein